VGSFINNLPIRVRLDVRESLLPWLQRLQLQQLATQPYEYVSPVQIHVWSELADNEPLFDTLLIFQPSLDSARKSKGNLALTKLHGNLATVYPLTLSVVEEDVELRFLAVYEAQHLGQDRAAQLVGDLVSLLEKIADKPNQTLGELIGVSAMKSGQTSPELSAKTRYSANSEVEQPVWSTRSQAIGSEKEVEQKLIGVWQDVLGVAPINRRENFFDLGGTSLQAMQLFTHIDALFGKSLPLASLIQDATVEHLAKTIVQDKKDLAWSPLVPIQPEGSNPPFFCIHGLTGDVLWFRELGQCLAPQQPLYGVQARGLDGVQEPFNQIEDMAAYYIHHMRSLQPQGPYFLGGASFGGTVALEIAQQLVWQGERVGLLVMFDHVPPVSGLNEIHQGLTGQILVAHKRFRNFPYWLASFLQLGAGPIIARAQRKVRVATKRLNGKLIASGNGLDKVAAADLLDYGAELPPYRQQLIEAHYQAIEKYKMKRYPGRITLFQARAQPLTGSIDPADGWRNLEIGDLDFEIVPGSHEGMFKAPNVQRLTELLLERMAQAVEEPPVQANN
jgi:thioesterase domain-containing protein/acyl carrier protein